MAVSGTAIDDAAADRAVLGEDSSGGLGEHLGEPERIARLKHRRASRWMHWINFPLLTVMIWSGLRIYWANDVYEPFFPDWLYDVLQLDRKLARGMAFHFTFGWLFAINGIAYGIYTLLSGEWRHLVPDRHALKESIAVMLHDLKLSRKPLPPQGRYNSAQRLSYTGIIILGAVAVISGLAIYKPTQLSWLTAMFGGYEGARLVHFVVTIAFILFFVVHILQVIRAGWKNFFSMVTGYELEEVSS